MPPSNAQYEFLNERVDQSIEISAAHFNAASSLDNKIANQISTVSLIFTVVSIALAVFGLLLGYYINSTLKKITKIRNDVRKTSEYIDSKNNELFEKLQRSLVKATIDRLNKVPEDIGNLVSNLFAADLLEEDFASLKSATLKAKQLIGRDYLESYISLLLQHFPLLSLRDKELRTIFIENIDNSQIKAMHPIDIDN